MSKLFFFFFFSLHPRKEEFPSLHNRHRSTATPPCCSPEPLYRRYIYDVFFRLGKKLIFMSCDANISVFLKKKKKKFIFFEKMTPVAVYCRLVFEGLFSLELCTVSLLAAPQPWNQCAPFLLFIYSVRNLCGNVVKVQSERKKSVFRLSDLCGTILPDQQTHSRAAH